MSAVERQLDVIGGSVLFAFGQAVDDILGAGAWHLVQFEMQVCISIDGEVVAKTPMRQADLPDLVPLLRFKPP